MIEPEVRRINIIYDFILSHIYKVIYLHIIHLRKKRFTYPTGCCGYCKRDLKILTYNEIGNNILSISFMFDAHEEQYSKKNLHIQQDVVSIIKMI